MAVPMSNNLLLRSLTAGTLRELEAERVPQTLGAIIVEDEHVPEFVYFPERGAVGSVVRSTSDGVTVESGLVGNEGAAIVDVMITSAEPSLSRVVVQIEGMFFRIPTRQARQFFRADEPFRELVLSFTKAYLDQVSQNTLCNRLHAIEQRLAKWLLAVRDRVATDELRLTHEFLSHMLGTHRPGVTLAVRTLDREGVISHARNRILIRDRAGLVRRACECSHAAHASLMKLCSGVASPAVPLHLAG